MHLFSNLNKSSLGLLIALGVMFSTHAMGDTPEKTTDRLTRIEASGLSLSSSLTKNIYKQVAYQDQYTVEVPYQEQETYYENVPYQEQEAYTDYESYVDTEYRCHDVTDYRRQCRTENECFEVPGDRQCRNEQVCNTVPGRETCQNVEECGTSATGQRICKTRQVCQPGQPQQECHNEQKCWDTPGRRECRPREICENVPYTRQECHNESVTKTRPVTKYRTVTKYRQEARTRTVTKYRTETKCCVTKYRQEFDHQANLQVLIHFPADSQLKPSEQEVIKVSLLGDETQPSAGLEFVSTVFNYKIVDQRLNGRTFEITLAIDLNSTGPLKDAKLYSDPAMLSNWDLNGVAENAALIFKDSAPLNRVVKTTYTVTLTLKTATGVQVLGKATVDRENVKVSADGLSRLELVSDLQMGPAASSIVAGALIQVDVQVVRLSPQLNSNKPVILKKSFVDRNRN